MGRATDIDSLKAENPDFDLVGPSDIPISPSDPTPRPLTTDEIKTYVQWYADAADKAVNKAGFDGVELLFAGGYLPDQFLQDVSNQRSDEYGGSIENRARFPLEIIEAVSNTVGQDRVGFRISPWNPLHGMRMGDPKPTFSYFVSQAKERFPDLAYLHAIEPRMNGGDDREADDMESNDFLREIWDDKAFIATGGYDPQTAVETVNTKGGLIAFGRHYIANVSFLSSHDLRWVQSWLGSLSPAWLAIAPQVWYPADEIPTFYVLHCGGPTRIHRLSNCNPFSAHGSPCYRCTEFWDHDYPK